MLQKTQKMKQAKETAIKAFRKKGCNIAATCLAANISRQTFYRWRKLDEEFAEAIEESEESVIDNVESKLLAAVNDDKLDAIKFFLRTKGKKRGYVERQEITGGDGQKLFEVKIIDAAEDSDIN